MGRKKNEGNVGGIVERKGKRGYEKNEGGKGANNEGGNLEWGGRRMKRM